MISFIFITTLLVIINTAMCQDAQQSSSTPDNVDNPMKNINYYQIQSNRVNFFSVNENYKCVEKKIYYVDKPGFIINLGWDSIKIKSDWYIILTYPGYGNTPVQRPQHQNAPNWLMSLEPTKLNSIKTILPDTLKPSFDSTLSNTSQFDVTSNTDDWERNPINGKSGLILMIKKTDFDNLSKIPLYSNSFLKPGIAFGQLTVPFKLRGATAGKEFSMTTDVSIGAYVGLKWRLSRTQKYFLTLPVVAGLTLININDNTTSIDTGSTKAQASGIKPGWTLASGLILQIGTFDLGLVTGWDFASDVGKTWIYQGKQWIAFSVGYSFLK